MQLNNTQFTLSSNDLRPAFVCEDGKDIVLNDWEIPATTDAQAIVRLEEVVGADISDMEVKGEARAFVLVEGASSKGIRVSKNKTPGIKEVVELSDEVDTQNAFIK